MNRINISNDEKIVLIDFHKKVVLGKVLYKLPHEFDEMTAKEFDLLYRHLGHLQEYEKLKMDERISTRE